MIDEAIRPIEWVVLNDFTMHDDVGVWEQDMFPISDTVRTLMLTGEILRLSKNTIVHTRSIYHIALDMLLTEVTQRG